MPLINTVRELVSSLRIGPYADGGYPLFWLTSDGATLHHACEHCNARIESAYAEPE